MSTTKAAPIVENADNSLMEVPEAAFAKTLMAFLLCDNG